MGQLQFLYEKMGRDELVTDVVKATRPARKPWRYGVNVRVCSAYRPPEAPRATLHDSTRPICCASRDSKVLAGGPTALDKRGLWMWPAAAAWSGDRHRDQVQTAKCVSTGNGMHAGSHLENQVHLGYL